VLPSPPWGGAHPVVTTDVPATSASKVPSADGSDRSSQGGGGGGRGGSSSALPVSIFSGKRVLILGNGETAFDLGFAAASHGAAAVAMATRHGFVSVPASFPGTALPPLDCLIMNLGTHGCAAITCSRVSPHTQTIRKSIFF
jgi:hypothetical protein